MASLILKLKSDPFLGDPPKAGELYEAVGRYIRVWSRLEGHFNDVLIMLLRHRMVVPLKTQLKLGKDGPVSFKRKLKLWRRVWSGVPAFAKASDAALKFATQIGDANRTRNALLHNAWQEFTDHDALGVKSSSWRLEDGKLSTPTSSFNLAQVQAMMAVADDLNTWLVKFSFYVAESGRRRTAEEAAKPGLTPQQP